MNSGLIITSICLFGTWLAPTRAKSSPCWSRDLLLPCPNAWHLPAAEIPLMRMKGMLRDLGFSSAELGHPSLAPQGRGHIYVSNSQINIPGSNGCVASSASDTVTEGEGWPDTRGS
jgi:hypothetical protein